MSLLKNIYYQSTSLLPTGLVKKFSAAYPLLPYHHLVTNENVSHVQQLYPYKNVRQFTDDLDYLLKYFQPVSAIEIADAVKRGSRLPRHSFLLTFDDGFREIYDVVAPILLKKGVPAVFFINPAFIDNKELFYRSKISLLIGHLKTEQITGTQHEAIAGLAGLQSVQDIIPFLKKITQQNKQLLDDIAAVLSISFTEYLATQKPFLTHQQLHKLAAQGFELGAHSWDHPYYHLLSEDEQILQTIRSGEYVRTTFQQPLKLFSFPHYDTPIPLSFFDRLRKEWNPDLLFGIQNQKKELQNRMLHRFNAERPHLPMSRQLNGVLLLTFLQKLMGKSQINRD